MSVSARFCLVMFLACVTPFLAGVVGSSVVHATDSVPIGLIVFSGVFFPLCVVIALLCLPLTKDAENGD